MIFNVFKNTVLLFLLVLISCGNFSKGESKQEMITIQNPEVIVGANQTDHYLKLLEGKRVGIVANQSSVIFKDSEQNTYSHLVDSLLKLKINIVKVFSPEHGFRGKADAGELVDDSKDNKTGLSIISLHGKNRKPTTEQLKDVDVVVFDLQDVGVRFYTYLSTMHYVMEACAEANIPMIVLDRPNPNGYYIDGPVLDLTYKSFVGMHPVPLVYGMTIGEYALMINGEHWLENKLVCNLTVIRLKNYTHKTYYSLPIKPSPNLPNDKAINLYPSLDIFRGTIINVGRGTNLQMQCYGAPFFPKSDFSYIPKPNEGDKHPRFENKICYGVDLRKEPKLHKFTLKYIIDAYNKTPKSEIFFGTTFTVHAGNEILQKQIESGLTEEEIRATWQEDLENFKKIRVKYLIYK
ncbi:DUF1343 domain-containing protein [Gaetbulibacter aquiaggeris]|uniref:DUF1343 domain-containing protein n=1 Tax=Gaetbulibacter aquiaggeris TaxID=1735373 RepID=A0ABW7MMY2_9FLAO